MDAITLLKKDHDKVRELFKEAEGLGERTTTRRRVLFDKIDEELTLHTKVEEKIFYPAFKAKAKNVGEREEVLEAIEEHAVAKRLIKELEALEPSDERYKAKLAVLMESVRHHADEEERTMFPMAQELFDKNELEELGEKIESAKDRGGSLAHTTAHH